MASNLQHERATLINPDVEFGDVPTVLCDGVIGYAHAAGVVRVLLGAFSFRPQGAVPALKARVELAIPGEAVDNIVAQLQEIVSQMRRPEQTEDD